MSTLYADCFVGEMGWHLFCWQGYLRQQSKNFDKTVIACCKGYEILYKDFADEIISCEIDCEECDMWVCKGYKPPTFMQRFDRALGADDAYYPSNQLACRYDHTHKLDQKPPFNKFPNQTFVKLGQSSLGKSYDIIIHARNKKNKVNAGMNSNYRNWPTKKWNQLINKFQDQSIACIGTKKGALHVGGTDLRGISLEDLCNILASSSVIVGPSSGPIHLAALCECSQVTWWGDPYGPDNEIRFKKDWNPFNTPVNAEYHKDWNPEVEHVTELVKQHLDK